jgi:hypothetical protein
MLEYTLGLYPDILKKIEGLFVQIKTVKSVKKMNRMLNQCKEIVMGLQFKASDQHHAFLKEQLMKFGIDKFESAWISIKRVWASKFNERAFLATKKLGVSLK